MKKFLSALILSVLAAGCTSSTKYGDCVGVAEPQDPNFNYDLDTGNMVMAIIFFETVFVPVFVILGETYCPVSPKSPNQVSRQ